VNRTQAHWPGWTGGRAAVAIRQVRPDDLAALSDFFTGLSAYTRYLRFFGPVTPRDGLLRALAGLAGNIDALLAVRGGVIVGHAMAADRAEPSGSSVTDIGVVVADAWRGRGLGSALVRALVTGAQARGVTSLAMDVLHANRRVLAMITGHWPAADIGVSRDCVAVRIGLPRYQPPPGRPVGPAAGHLRGDSIRDHDHSTRRRRDRALAT
jgi:ribosomal protein S18 acetylase RimI-like enzyme